MFPVSQGQRISSRCGAVKSVLGPTRLVTVEGSPAIRGFCLCSGRFSSVPTPPLLRHQSPPPSAPPSAPAGQRAGGRRRGWRRTLTPSCWGPRLRRSGDRSVHRSPCQRRRRAASPTLPAPVPRDTPLLLLPLCPRPPPPRRRAPHDPSSPRAPGRAAEAQGRRHRARPFAQPRRWSSAQRAGAGRGDGVLTPSPSPVPARDRREPLLPPACLSAQAHATREGSHWEEPRPRAEHLRTPSPPRAANPCWLLRVREPRRGACAFRGNFRSRRLMALA